MNTYIINKKKLAKIKRNISKYIMQYGLGSKKWDTLQHNGVLFYPEYIPHKIPIKYDTENIILNPEAEEYITYYVQSRFDKYKTKKFNNTFFKDWIKILSAELRKKIIDFENEILDKEMLRNVFLKMCA